MKKKIKLECFSHGELDNSLVLFLRGKLKPTQVNLSGVPPPGQAPGLFSKYNTRLEETNTLAYFF
jgi:hypothetical protein